MKKLFLLFGLVLFVTSADAQVRVRGGLLQRTPQMFDPPHGVLVADGDPTGNALAPLSEIPWDTFMLLQECNPVTTALVRNEAEWDAAAANGVIRDIVVCGTVTFTGPKTVTTKRVNVPRGSRIEAGGFNVVLQEVNAGIYQIFETPLVPVTTTTVFGGRMIYPQWWDEGIGVVGVDAWPAIQSAVNAADPATQEHVGITIFIKRGLYDVSNTVDMLTPVIIWGENSIACSVRATAPFTGNSVFRMSGEIDSLLNLRVDANGVANVGIECVTNTSEQARIERVRVVGFMQTGVNIPDTENGSPQMVNLYVLDPGAEGTTAIHLGSQSSKVSIVDTTINSTTFDYLIGVFGRGVGSLRMENVNVERCGTGFYIVSASHATAILTGCTTSTFTTNAFRFAGVNLNWAAFGCKARQIIVLEAPLVNGLVWDEHRSSHNRDFPDAVQTRVFSGFRGASTESLGAFMPDSLAMWTGDNTNVYRLTGSVGVGAIPTRKFEVTDSSMSGGIVTGVSSLNSAGAFGILSAYKQKGAGAAAANDEANLIFEHKNSNGNRNEYASIAGGINSATAGAHNGYLSFETTNAGTVRQERMRITTAGEVGIGTISPSVRSVLDLTSTTKGFLPPRMTEGQRDAIVTPPAGLMVYNTTTNKMNFFNGTIWEAITSL